MRFWHGNGGRESGGRSPLPGPRATFQAQEEAVCPLGSGQRAWAPLDMGQPATTEQALPAPSPKSCLPLTNQKINSVYFSLHLDFLALRAQGQALLLYPTPQCPHQEHFPPGQGLAAAQQGSLTVWPPATGPPGS